MKHTEHTTTMNIEKQRREAAEAFAQRWQGRGYEKGESQAFWIDLLQSVMGAANATGMISFESRVKLASTSFIDAYIEDTKVLIEQKSVDKDLRKPVKQSDGSMLTPFQQAKRYAAELPWSKRPRWVVACNFASFLVYDMENPTAPPEEVALAELGKDFHRLDFLTDPMADRLKKEMEVSMQAGRIVGELYDKLLEQYGPAPTAADLHSLNVLCVRLVFLLYAEDSGVMGKDQFLNYMMSFNSENMRIALRELFDTLATPQERRDRFTDPKLAAFPYVNGGLFSDKIKADIPPFDLKAKELLLNRASRDFDWSYISPTIFGAVFESTLNPETRRKGGMHYTSIENIHRVIDPLFFSALQDEFQAVKAMPQGRSRDAALDALQDRMASMTFLDPACGSGNFLTETFLSLRRLENKIIALRHNGEALMGEFHNPVKVSISQFHGIEINDFACTVATTAMWIAEAQTLAETERIVRRDLDFLPLKPYHNIMEGNALRMEWPETRYIIGNPPFVGARMKNKEQADDMLALFGKKWKNWGNLDYVAAWYHKAAELMGKQPGVRAALVSTNSITQGEQVAALWKPLHDRHPGLGIDFA